jgi:hypothetical protein
MEVTVNKHSFRKLATVGAAAALTLQLLAGVASAAVPNATSHGQSFGAVGGDGWAGFTTTLDYQDNSTLAKLYLDIQITNGASVEFFSATKGTASVAKSCTVTAALIQCAFKTVRNGDSFTVTFAVKPASEDAVTAIGGWSSTGFVLGDNNSHGDAWDIASSATDDNTLTAPFVAGTDFAAGWGNRTLNTSGAFNAGNPQIARLANLPGNKYSSVDDGGAADGFGFKVITIVVDGGALQDTTFQLLISYPKGSTAPKSFTHTLDDNTTVTLLPCVKGAAQLNCFTFDKKTLTATIYLNQNGTLKRAG